MAITINQPKPVSDAELLDLSRRNPGYQFERQSDGALTVTPTGTKSGYRSGEVLRQPAQWSRTRVAGPTFDSSTGFHLRDGSVLSPDAAWLRRDRLEALSPEDQEAFAPLCPDTVFEVRSKSDAIDELRAKMRAYLNNGARVAVVIDPYDRFVEIWRPDREPERHRENAVTLDPELPDFVLDTEAIYA
jgi:Uma2 family endonuclease